VASRVWPKLYVMGRAAPGLLLRGRRQRPERVQRVLIAHHLLLGDTLMLTPLLKKARERYPDAEIVMTVPRPYAVLYAGRPYGVKVLPFDVRSVSDHAAMRSERDFDLALVPGDNRWSWLARMLGARWVVAFAPDEKTYKDTPVDEFLPMPQEPLAWGDIAATLLEGAPPTAYGPSEWPAPPFPPYEAPQGPYAVLHLGASSPHKHWPTERWRAVMAWVDAQGYEVVLSAGRGEESLLRPLDADGRRSRLAAKLDLAQLWDLLRHARFVVCPDTGIAHMGRLVGTPTVAIYGPGSPISTGPGRFWAASPFRAVWDPAVPCRDQDRLFDRRVAWVRHCWRTVAECGDPVCIRRVAVDEVISAIAALSQAGHRTHG
jgi:ADP-heptose:LPS heptosyltransferase